MSDKGIYHIIYKAPLGFMLTDIEAESREDALREFWTEHHRDTCDVIYTGLMMSCTDCGCDKTANDGGEEPLDAVSEPFEPEVVPSGEEHEVSRGKDGIALRGLVSHLVSLLGKPEKVKLLRLGKHSGFVHGPLGSDAFETLRKVSELSSVLPDFQQVNDQVCGDTFH